MNFYTLSICGLKRELPIVAISPKMKIASFNLLGDAELVRAAAKEMAARLRGEAFDYLVGPEVKVVPLLQEISNLLSKDQYVILRKKIHGYMVRPLSSHSPSPLVINGPDADLLTDSNVVLIDDVVSTGKTFREAETILTGIKAKVVKGVALLKQGEEPAEFNFPVEFLGHLPLFQI